MHFSNAFNKILTLHKFKSLILKVVARVKIFISFQINIPERLQKNSRTCLNNIPCYKVPTPGPPKEKIKYMEWINSYQPVLCWAIFLIYTSNLGKTHTYLSNLKMTHTYQIWKWHKWRNNEYVDVLLMIHSVKITFLT